MVRQFIKIFLLTAFFIAASQITALADKHSFTLVNYSGKTIQSFYVWRSGQSGTGWEDRLGMSNLKHGQTIKLTLENDNANFWDLRADLEDGNYWVWFGVELKKISTVTIDSEGVAHFR